MKDSKHVKYTVEISDTFGGVVYSYDNLRLSEAKEIAKSESSELESDQMLFVRFIKANDGTVGFLNKHEGHSYTGKDWGLD